VNREELLYALRTDDDYVKTIMEELIFPIRDELLRLCGVELRPYQRELSDKIIYETLKARNQEIGVLWSRQVGKTETLADTVLTLFLFYLNVPLEFRVGWFCPAQSQSVLIARKRIVQRYEEAKELFENLGVHLVKGYGRERVGTSSPLLIFRNDNLNVEGHVRSLSANPKSNIKGDTLDLIILEDAQEIDEEKMKVDIFPMASKGAPLVLVGVPVPDVSVMNRYFIETIEKNPRNAFLTTVDWRRAAALDKNFPKEIEAYERGSTTYRYYIDRYRDHVDKMIKQLGEDSEAFQSQYCLKWFSGARKLMTLNEVLDLEKDYTPNPENLRFWGLDTAKVLDSTVCVVIERFMGEHHIIGLWEKEGTDYVSQSKELIEWLKQFKPLRYGMIDSTGGGELFIDISRKGLHEIGIWDGFDFRSREEVNRMFQLLSMDLRKGRIHYSKKNLDSRCLNTLIEQLHNVDRVYHGHYLWLETPDHSRIHDDYVHALALARYASEEKSHSLGIGNLNL